MIDLDDIRAFQKAGAFLSFSAAARALGVRKSAVSRSIQRLEAELHVRLFERNTRNVALTAAGQTLLIEIEDIASRLDRFVGLAAELNQAPRGQLRISAESGFGLEVLTELIPDFAELYPEVNISLDLTSRMIDLIGDHVDIAFRMGRLPDSSLTVTRLGALKCSLCASRVYLERRGIPQDVEDLTQHDLMTIPGPDGRPGHLRLLREDGIERLVPAKSRVTANDLHAICQMVVRGTGIAAMADFAITTELESGRLAVVVPDWRPAPIDMNIIMPGGKARSPAVRAFIDFIRQRMATRRDWFAV